MWDEKSDEMLNKYEKTGIPPVAPRVYYKPLEINGWECPYCKVKFWSSWVLDNIVHCPICCMELELGGVKVVEQT